MIRIYAYGIDGECISWTQLQILSTPLKPCSSIGSLHFEEMQHNPTNWFQIHLSPIRILMAAKSTVGCFCCLVDRNSETEQWSDNSIQFTWNDVGVAGQPATTIIDQVVTPSCGIRAIQVRLLEADWSVSNTNLLGLKTWPWGDSPNHYSPH